MQINHQNQTQTLIILVHSELDSLDSSFISHVKSGSPTPSRLPEPSHWNLQKRNPYQRPLSNIFTEPTNYRTLVFKNRTVKLYIIYI